MGFLCENYVVISCDFYVNITFINLCDFDVKITLVILCEFYVKITFPG